MMEKSKSHSKFRDTMHTTTPAGHSRTSSGVAFGWNIGTYIRILPDLKKQKNQVEYAQRDTEVHPGDYRGVLELKIPDDADPSFSLNSDTGILKYEFDKVFDADATQSTIFEVVAKEKILGAFDGINSTVFAYGQTGSGKTYTIFGGDSFQDRGLIPRSIACLFKEYRAKKNLNFSVRCRVSFTEVYKETVYDLLDQKKKTLPLEQWHAVQVLEGDQGLTLRNVNVFDVETEDDALALFFLGSTNRHTAATAVNDKSSRSHAIFTMIVECKGVRSNGKTVFTSGKINLVDLAGSERIHKGLNSKETIEEAKSINLALHYLENVIVSLRDHRQNSKHEHSDAPSFAGGHVPYRNSMLTSVLRDSLGGNCRSAFILNISSERGSFEETVSTCRFGQRLADVKVHVHANAEISLADQLKACKAQLRGTERRCVMLEEEKALLMAELAAERQSFHDRWESRPLTAQEKADCKQCVHNLFAAAKEAAALTAAAVNATDDGGTGTSPMGGAVPPGSPEDLPNSPKNALPGAVSPPPLGDLPTDAVKAAEEASRLVSSSQETLYTAAEQMDRAVLIELSTAMGGLVQTMYLEREKAKAEEHKRQMKKQRLAAERDARAKAKADAEQQDRDRQTRERVVDSEGAAAAPGQAMGSNMGMGSSAMRLFEHVGLEASPEAKPIDADGASGGPPAPAAAVSSAPASTAPPASTTSAGTGAASSSSAAGGGPGPPTKQDNGAAIEVDLGRRSPRRVIDAGTSYSPHPSEKLAHSPWKDDDGIPPSPPPRPDLSVSGKHDASTASYTAHTPERTVSGSGPSPPPPPPGGTSNPTALTQILPIHRPTSHSLARTGSPPRVPRIELSPETYQMIVRGDVFYVSNFLGIRSSRHYFVAADIKGIGWRPTAAVGADRPNTVPFINFERAQIDDRQSKRGHYVISLIPRNANEKALVLEYQTPNGAKAMKWHQALSLCVDKAWGRV